MTAVLTSLRRRESIADQTMAFLLEKLAGFGFRPGQTIMSRLITAGTVES
jgi:hypothetical protein